MDNYPFISNRFTFEDLTRSPFPRFQQENIDCALQNETIINNLRVLAGHLERAEKILGAPIQVLMAYRCPILNNHVVGTKPGSVHELGLGADILCPVVGSPLEVAKLLYISPLPFDSLVNELEWVHLSFITEGNYRRLALTWSGGAFDQYRAGIYLY